jgi:hypothetical protein
MRRQGCCPYHRYGLLAALIPMLSSGCMTFCNPVGKPPKDQLLTCQSIPAPCRNRVHIFLMHGLDPLDMANLEGVRDYLNALGFLKTYYGQLYHYHEFLGAVRRIHKEDPGARFVVMGFSFGANRARILINAVKEDPITIDLLVYCGGNTLDNTERTRPANVLHAVNILAVGCIWNGTTLDNADNINYDDCFHFGSPAHRKTLALLAEQLNIVASRVPFVPRSSRMPQFETLPKFEPKTLEEAPKPRRLPPEETPPEMAPPPRPVAPRGAGAARQPAEDRSPDAGSSEWGFMNPRGPGQEPPIPELPSPVKYVPQPKSSTGSLSAPEEDFSVPR